MIVIDQGRVAIPGGDDPDPEPTIKKKPDPDLIDKKTGSEFEKYADPDPQKPSLNSLQNPQYGSINLVDVKADIYVLMASARLIYTN